MEQNLVAVCYCLKSFIINYHLVWYSMVPKSPKDYSGWKIGISLLVLSSNSRCSKIKVYKILFTLNNIPSVNLTNSYILHLLNGGQYPMQKRIVCIHFTPFTLRRHFQVPQKSNFQNCFQLLLSYYFAFSPHFKPTIKSAKIFPKMWSFGC